MQNSNTVSDKLKLKLSLPNDLLVASDLHLSAKTTQASLNVQGQLGQKVEELTHKPNATVVLNGDIFELWAGKAPSVKKALSAHSQFCAKLKAFSAKPNHHLVLVVGNHDGKIAWSPEEQKSVYEMIGAKICLSLELTITAQKGTKTILFEHGHQLDPDNAFADPRDPNDKPFGQYIVQTALPIVTETQGKLFEGINHLAEPHKFPKFAASRVLYREIFSRVWWLLVPLVALLLLRMFLEYGLFSLSGNSVKMVTQIIVFTELAVFINAVVLVVGVWFIAKRLLARAKTIPGVEGEVNHNKLARAKAEQEIASGKVVGYFTGHTHRPQLTQIKNGFYANSGCGTEMVEAAKARFGLPNTYVSRNHLHWLEVQITAQHISTQHWAMIHRNKKQTQLESLATKRAHFEYPLGKQSELTISL